MPLSFTNVSDQEWEYGHAFHLEVWLDDGYYRIPTERELVFTKEVIVVPPGITVQETCRIDAYGDLPVGAYRIILQDEAERFVIE